MKSAPMNLQPTRPFASFRPGSPITEPVARLHTARAWRAYQRAERARQWCIRIALLNIPALSLLAWQLLRK
jgi:hypothetical protein